MSAPPAAPRLYAKWIAGALGGLYLLHFLASLSAIELLPLLALLGVYALLAMSLNMICGLTGLLQLGHAGFYAVGAYAAGLVAIYGTVPELGRANLLLGGAAAVVAAALFSLLIGVPCLRLRGDYLAIATLGFGEIVRLSLTEISFPGGAMYPGERIGENSGIAFTEFPGALWPEHAAYDAQYSDWWLVWLLVVLCYLFFRNLKRSAVGRALMCIREDEIAAEAMGIHVPYHKILAFVLSAGVAGLAGALFFHLELTVQPNDFTLMHSIQFLLVVVLGGLGSFSGALIGAVVLGLLPEVLRRISLAGVEWLPAWVREIQPSQHQMILYALMLILLIRLAPDGLLGMDELPAWRRRRGGGKPQ